MDTPLISVLIPVYRESDQLQSLLDQLLKDPYEKKEVIVVVDEPTEKSLKLADKYKDKVKFIFNKTRLGKVTALNNAVKQASGEILVFIDSDIAQIKPKNSFLAEIARATNHYEVVEMSKRVFRKGVLSRLVHYDYLSYSAINWVFSRKLNKCLAVNGAAFAIKKSAFEKIGGFSRVVCEDLDIGTKSYLHGMKYKFLNNLSVYMPAPPSWKTWFKQRRRWGCGVAQWIFKYWKELAKFVKENPLLTILGLLMLIPSLVIFFTFISLSLTLGEYLAVTFILLTALKYDPILIILVLISLGYSLYRNLIPLIIATAVITAVFYYFARKLEYEFKIYEFLLYYFIYSPIWLLILILSFIRVSTKREPPKDWKV